MSSGFDTGPGLDEQMILAVAASEIGLSSSKLADAKTSTPNSPQYNAYVLIFKDFKPSKSPTFQVPLFGLNEPASALEPMYFRFELKET